MPIDDYRIAQVRRILAMMFHATYPGEGAWRFRIACMMLERGATAEAENGENDICGSQWFAAAVSILKMNPKNLCLDWNDFSPKEMTAAANEFLPAAKALILWVDSVRKRVAEEQECDYTDIGFMPDDPAGIIYEKLDGDGKGPTTKLIKELLFTEDRFRNKVYNPLFFEQIEEGMGVDGDDMDWDEPTDDADVTECSVIAESLWENRAEREGRQDDVFPLFTHEGLQAMIENLSESNEEFVEKERAESEAVAEKMFTGVGKDFFSAGFPIGRDVRDPIPPETFKDVSTEIKDAAAIAASGIVPVDGMPFSNEKTMEFIKSCREHPEWQAMVECLETYCDEQARNAIAINSKSSDMWMKVVTALERVKRLCHHGTAKDLVDLVDRVVELAQAAGEKLCEDARCEGLKHIDVAKLISSFRSKRFKTQRAMGARRGTPGPSLTEMQLKQVEKGLAFLTSQKKKNFASAAREALKYESAVRDGGNTETDGYLGKAGCDYRKAVEALSRAISRRQGAASRKRNKK